MTQTNDPPLISSIELIPDAAEKADLDAPNTSGGKLVIGQAPNITITETNVVADADERLALDVQEGDIAIQSNVSTSFIFTGGDNIANNWQTIDFDAVGAIDGEDINPQDITPRNITASGDISLQDLTVSGDFNGADTSAASAGEALTADGTGGFSFASAGGDLVSLVSATPESIGGFFISAGAMSVITASETAMQEVAASETAMQEVAASETAMQEVIASPAALDEVINSQTAMQEVINSPTAMQEVRNSPTADEAFYLSDLYAGTLDTFAGINTGVTGGIDDIAASQTAMQEVAASETAMQEVAPSETAMQEVAASQIAMQEVGSSVLAFNEVATSTTARNEIETSNVAINVLNGLATSFSETDSNTNNSTYKQVEVLTDVNGVWVKTATSSGGLGGQERHRLLVRGGQFTTTTDKFVFDVEHTGNRASSSNFSVTTSGEKYRP